jgi:PPP family 3-phenylpropionic acid transporter
MAMRLFFYSLKPSIIAILFLQLFHALTYTAFHIGIVNFISTMLPDQVRASGQTLYSGIVWGLGGMIGGKICGGIEKTHGRFVMFRISSIIALLAALITHIFGKEPQSPLENTI